jgi:D-arginine dehydrogenase
MREQATDVLVIGAGMAGTSVAAELARDVSVRLIEMESQPGYHSTGRSAALFLETYGNATVRALSRASRATFFTPPDDFSATPLVRPRLVLAFGHEGQEAAFQAFPENHAPEGQLFAVDQARALELCPILRREGLLGGLVDSNAADIEVHELQQNYLRLLRQRGGSLVTGARASAIERTNESWRVQCGGAAFCAPILINAAGAWADEVGAMAGAARIGLQPCRRTAALVDANVGPDWAMIVDVEEQFYAKPDAGLLLVSPADETPSPPCDAYPEDLDVAIAIDRLQGATTLEIRRVRSRWAGLRSFVRDRSPVVGFDLHQPTFFWLAALGGYGIQTAPAVSRAAASLVLGRPIDDDILHQGFDENEVSPDRLRPSPKWAPTGRA